MDAFNYYLPLNLVFGRGKVLETGAVAAGLGSKALIVTGKNSVRKSGLLDKISGSLSEKGIQWDVFDNVGKNPLASTVSEGADIVRQNGCDFVIGIGGGSAMDAAKAIAFMAINEGQFSDYTYARKTAMSALPILLIPTTAGTGSEGNTFSVITDDDTRDKKGLKHPALMPSASIIDPELLTTLPRHVIAATGFDALDHCVDAFIAKRANPFSDMVAKQGIETVVRALPKVYENPNDLDAWDEMALAALYGGMAIGIAGSGLSHALEHPVSGLLNVVHGQGLAAILPEVARSSHAYAPGRFAWISVAMGSDPVMGEAKLAEECADRINEFLERFKLNYTLKDLGVRKENLPWLTENCVKTMKGSIENNPVVFSADDIRNLYENCL